MALPAALILNIATGLMNGPVSKVLDALVKDQELRRKLESELQGKLADHLGKSGELQQAIVLAEIKSEHWLTRSWRPLMMLTLLGFVLFVGLVLPLLDAIIGHPVAFNPRWQSLPAPFWDFLSIGIGGYIGGRTLEKVAAQVIGAKMPR